MSELQNPPKMTRDFEEQLPERFADVFPSLDGVRFRGQGSGEWIYVGAETLAEAHQ